MSLQELWRELGVAGTAKDQDYQLAAFIQEQKAASPNVYRNLLSAWLEGYTEGYDLACVDPVEEYTPGQMLMRLLGASHKTRLALGKGNTIESVRSLYLKIANAVEA